MAINNNQPCTGQASTSASKFVATKFNWLYQIAADATLPPLAARIAIVLATEYFNKKTGTAWPSQATLSRHLGGVTDRAIRKSIAMMAKNGHLAVEVRRGRYQRRMIIKNRNERSGIDDDKPEQPFLFQHDVNRNENALKPESNGRLNRNVRSYKPFERTLLEPIEGETPKKEVGTRSKNRRRRQQTPWPDGFILSEEMITHAVDKAGWNSARVAAEFERFENYHRAKGDASADWNASWRTWVANGIRFDNERQQPQAPLIDDQGNRIPVRPPPDRSSPFRRRSNTELALRGGASWPVTLSRRPMVPLVP